MTPDALADALIRPRRRKAHSPAPARRLSAGDFEVALHAAGDAQAPFRVLAVHGWEADHRDLLGLAARLPFPVAVTAPDLPAHGASSGGTMMIPEAARALLAVDAAGGPFDLVIAHSIGTAATLVALADGLRAGAAVLLAPPANYVKQLELGARAAGAPQALIDAALAVLRRRCPALDRIDSPAIASRVGIPALVVVAGRDRTLDPADGRAVASALPRGRLLDLPAATHRSVIEDPAVAAAMAELLECRPGLARAS